MLCCHDIIMVRAAEIDLHFRVTCRRGNGGRTDEKRNLRNYGNLKSQIKSSEISYSTWMRFWNDMYLNRQVAFKNPKNFAPSARKYYIWFLFSRFLFSVSPGEREDGRYAEVKINFGRPYYNIQPDAPSPSNQTSSEASRQGRWTTLLTASWGERF